MWYIVIVIMLAVALFVAYKMTLFVDARLEKMEKDQESLDLAKEAEDEAHKT
ncbi:hypothetical protein N8865_01850 [Francisellaceae bacterium]|nr:hypothetical protein [Francisellaceae bacterium]